jgi:hypothetical protein
MKNISLAVVCFLFSAGVKGQQDSNKTLLSQTGNDYLETLTRDVMESSRPEFGAPWECYNKDTPQNAVYLASVSCPFIAFKKQSLAGSKIPLKNSKKFRVQ